MMVVVVDLGQTNFLIKIDFRNGSTSRHQQLQSRIPSLRAHIGFLNRQFYKRQAVELGDGRVGGEDLAAVAVA